MLSLLGNVCMNDACHVKSTHVRVRVRLGAALSCSPLILAWQLADQRTSCLQYDCAWITQSGDMETRGEIAAVRGAGHYDLPVLPPSRGLRLTQRSCLSIFGFDRDFAACQLLVPHTVSFRRERGTRYAPPESSRVRASRHWQAQGPEGRAARATEPHFVPISIYVQY